MAGASTSESVAIAPNSRPEGANAMIDPGIRSEAGPEGPSAAWQCSLIMPRPDFMHTLPLTQLTPESLAATGLRPG